MTEVIIMPVLRENLIQAAVAAYQSDDFDALETIEREMTGWECRAMLARLGLSSA